MSGAATAPAKIHGAIDSISSDWKLGRFQTTSSLPSRFCFYVADPVISILQITFCAEQWKCSSFDFRNSKLLQILKRRIIKRWRTRRIGAVTSRNEHDHALPRAREQNAIGIS